MVYQFSPLFNVLEETIKRDFYVLRDMNLIKYVGSYKNQTFVDS